MLSFDEHYAYIREWVTKLMLHCLNAAKSQLEKSVFSTFSVFIDCK
jgi:hypothetical protein